MKMEEVLFVSILFNFKGSIGVEELEEPLIALGLATCRDDVKKLMVKVDEDGEITFEEFLDLVSGINSSNSGGNLI